MPSTLLTSPLSLLSASARLWVRLGMVQLVRRTGCRNFSRPVEIQYPREKWKLACEMPYLIAGHNNISVQPKSAEKEEKKEELKKGMGRWCAVAGFDEAGRGAFLGPLLCAIVILPSKETPIEITSQLPSLTSSDVASSSLIPHSNRLDLLLRESGVRDSKKVSPNKRSRLAQLIQSHSLAFRTVRIDADDIDKRRQRKENLNQITLHALLAMIQSLDDPRFDSKETINAPIHFNATTSISPSTLSHLQVDSFDSLTARLSSHLQNLLSLPSDRITVDHQADDRYLSVSCSSILAKAKRDELFRECVVEQLGQEELEKVGSGYSSDKMTRKWLRQRKAAGQEIPNRLMRHSWKLNITKNIRR